MIDYSYLTLQNPWWRQASAIDEDEKIQEFDHLLFRWNPKQILEASIQLGDITLITGPRQTGKSTAIKLLIRTLIKQGRPPGQVFYFNCDALSSEKDIIDLIMQYQATAQEEEMIIFLDEISSVANWPQGIKWLADAELFKRASVFLTGSSSISLKKSGEFLPGRRGRGTDITFLPISFPEYLALKGVHVAQIDPTVPSIRRHTADISHTLRAHYRSFMESGGFLRNINYGVTEAGNDLYLKTLKSELYKAGKKEDSLREVIRKILSSLSAQTSYTNIAEEAELGSKNTAIDYLTFLADSFFLKETKFWDIAANRIILKKNKKFYTIDPYIVGLFESFVTGSLSIRRAIGQIDESKLVENFIAGELLKAGHEFYFYQSTSELDFYIPSIKTGIEVKYKEKITHEDIKSLVKAERKIVISKQTLESRDSILIVPLYVFPLLDLTKIDR